MIARWETRDLPSIRVNAQAKTLREKIHHRPHPPRQSRDCTETDLNRDLKS